MRIFQPPGDAVRFLDHAGFVAQHTGHIANDRINHYHGGHFPAIADEVSYRNFPRSQPQPNALVKALITATQQEQASVLGQFLHHALRQPFTCRSQHDQQARRRGPLLYVLDARENRLTPDHHARTATEGTVVNTLVLAGGPVAEIPQMDLYQAGLQGEFDKTLAQIPLKNLRKQGQDIKAEIRPGGLDLRGHGKDSDRIPPPQPPSHEGEALIRFTPGARPPWPAQLLAAARTWPGIS